MSLDRIDAPTLFIGHTRFSVHNYGSAQFNATRDASRGVGFTEAEYTDWLYDENRLGPRTEIFTRYSLPQIARAAESYNLVHFVSHSPSLPQAHKERLRQAAEEYDFVEVNETSGAVGSLPSQKLLKVALGRYQPSDGVYGVYRLDDDDVLSVDYFEQMKPYVTPSFRGHWVSLGAGVSAIKDGSHNVFAREYYQPKNALGLLYVAGLTSNGEPERLKAPKHTVVDKYAPTVVDSREVAYFHLRHKGQDSSLDAKVRPFYTDAIERIRKGVRIDPAVIQKKFPLLADSVLTSPGHPQNAVSLSGPTELDGEGVQVAWGRAGSLILQLHFADVVLKAQEVSVNIQVETTDGSPADVPDYRRFFSSAKIRWSPDKRRYWTWLPHAETGEGYILPLEPPAAVRIIGVSITAEKDRVLPVSSITGYQVD